MELLTRYASGIEILIHDDYKADNKTVALNITKFFEAGQAVYIRFSARETEHLYATLRKIYEDGKIEG